MWKNELAFTMRSEPAAAAVLSIRGSRILVSTKWPTRLVANVVSMPCGERVYSGTIGRARQRVRHYVSANTANTVHSGLLASLMRMFRRSSLVKQVVGYAIDVGNVTRPCVEVVLT
jgi:hypothetical protein